MAFIGLDLGTTGCKAVLFGGDGRPCASGYREYPIDQPQPGWAEQDGEHVWACVLEALTEAVRTYEGKEPVTAIGLSVQGEAVAPVDCEGRLLGPFMLGMDTRTTAQCQHLRHTYGDDRLYAVTGMPNHTINTIVKLMWHHEHSARNPHRFVLYEDFLLMRLGGQPAISRCLASRTGLYDLRKRTWDPELLALAAVTADQLSPLHDSGTAVATLLPDLARQLGLPENVLLVTGGHDQACGALGAGVIIPGMAMVSSGTAEVMEVALAEPVANPVLARGGISIYEHVVPGLYVAMTLNHAGGIVLRWCRDALFPEAKQAAGSSDVYDYLLKGAPEGPSPVFCLPHLAGAGTPLLDTGARGAFTGLALAHTRADLMKAVLDGLTYELKANLEVLTQAGVHIGQLRAIGGGARSALWLQTKADVLGLTVGAPQVTEAACLGAGLLAAVASGGYTSLQDAVARTVTMRQAFRPDPAQQGQYAQAYERYRSLYPALRPI